MHSEAPPTSFGAPPPAFSILVAEDDPNERFLLQRAFAKAGVQVALQFLEDGQQVVDFLSGKPPFESRAKSFPPALLLLDLKMPGKDGFEVLEWLRLQPQLSNLPVMVLSSSSLSGDMVRARALGARHYLVKPSTFKDLVRLARNLEVLWRALCSRAPVEAVARAAD